MDNSGNIYLSAEDTLAGGGSTLYVLSASAIPEPSIVALGGLAALVGGGVYLSHRRAKI